MSKCEPSRLVALALSLTLVAVGPVAAQNDRAGNNSSPALPGTSETSDQPPSEPGGDTTPSIQPSLGPLGDPGGYRAFLAAHGITYNLTYIGETLGDVSGGARRGAIYEGRLDTQLDIDFDKAAGLKGLAFHTNFYQIQGHGLSGFYVGNLAVASSIEATPSTRLFELYFEQKVLDDKVSIRAGQLAADTEFLVSQYSGLFVNSAYGWPTITGVNLPNGGPAYPLATPALRLKWTPTEELTLLAAVFNGYPAGIGPGDEQANALGGVEFRARDPAFVIAEGAYAYKLGGGDTGLPGTVKLGGFYHHARFDDQRFAVLAPGATSPLLADSANSSGVPRRLRGDTGIYGVVDQLLYRAPGTEDGGLGVFARIAGSPGDRNLISFYADAGLTYKGLIPGRPDDTAGVSVSYARISDPARGFDRDTAFLNPAVFTPIRSAETLIEVTYQAQVVPGFTIQPDFQYIFRPGGGIVNPYSPVGAPIKDAAVAGVRATIHY